MIFEVWAPDAAEVEVEIGPARRALRPARPGWWAVEAEAGHGTDYAYWVDGAGPYPDPRSRRQPEGIFGPSRVYDHARFTWADHEWTGRDLRGAILYELHVGTFTPEGTFAAAAGRLGHLVELGVDLVEVMPVAPVPGARNWGYDGVDLFAVNETYGGPDGLKSFVDACHRAGLGVILDVVYNHLGPSGNFLGRFGPYLTGTQGSYWGEAVNLDGPHSDEVRRYLLDNAVQWLRDYHLDGLRLDAVHALHDSRATHFLVELAEEVEALACQLGRPLALIAESDLNDPRTVLPREAGGLGMTAQWNDDVHHAIHAAVTGEEHGYYADFASLRALAKALTEGFVHDGGFSAFRGRSHGRPFRGPAYRLVCGVQNHDQVGNRPGGDRMRPEALRAAAALLLTSPFTPMLFMGEEWGAASPFLFFTDHVEPGLREFEGERRRREFEGFGYRWDAPEPGDLATFARSRLDWAELGEERHRSTLCWYRDLIALRKAFPELTDPRLERAEAEFDEGAGWLRITRGRICVYVALCRNLVTSWSPDGAAVLLDSDAVSAGREGDLGTFPRVLIYRLAC